MPCIAGCDVFAKLFAFGLQTVGVRIFFFAFPPAACEFLFHVARLFPPRGSALGRDLCGCGADTPVILVSDHGFHSDHLRPKFTPRVPAGITVWHRPQGAFIASGPGFQRDELLFGARLLDVTPTILHHFGLLSMGASADSSLDKFF
jgi:hypothetical protein